MRLDLTGIDPVDHALARRCSVGDILTRAAATFGSRPALHDETGTWTYAELESQANRLAHGLSGLGVESESAVAIISPNCRHFLAAYFAAAKAGMVALPVNLLAGPEHVLHCLTDSRASVLVVHEALVDLVRGALPLTPDVRYVVVIPHGGATPGGDGGGNGDAGQDTDAAPDGPRILTWDEALAADDTNPETVIGDRQIVQCLYSSGTTSLPKGVLTSHLTVTVAATTNAAMSGLRWGAEPSVSTLVLPLFHTAGLNGVALPGIPMGATMHLLPAFDPEQLARTVSETRTTHFVGLPLMLEAIVSGAERGLDMSALEQAMYAMAPMSEAAYRRAQEALPDARIVLGSGMTECTPATVAQWPELYPDKADSWGYPSPSTENLVVEPGGDERMPTGVEGELAYRGPTVMEGYFNRPEANAEVFRGGWMHSGDLGRIDADGVVWFSDRVKDIVKSGGENVSSLTVERVLLDHPGVAEVGCIGRPHEKWGEQVVAVVVPVDPDVDPGDLRASVLEFGAERLPASARPREVHVLDALPRTATGKIRKVELRENLEAQHPTGPSA